MPLKLSLKPRERLIVGGAVVTNGSKPAEIYVENNVPILREKDILSEEKATSPCRRIYFSIQLMYIDDKNLKDYHTIYWDLVKEVIKAAPSTLPIIDQISQHILGGQYYQALKVAKKLIEYEEELLKHACESL